MSASNHTPLLEAGRQSLLEQFGEQSRVAGIEYGYDDAKLERFVTVRKALAKTAIEVYEITQLENLGEGVEKVILMAFPQLQEKLSDSEEERRALKRLAYIDDLTGLANRRAFEEAKATAEADENTQFIVLDANRFKETNDREGHESGDKLLNKIARHTEKTADQYGFGERVFRVGGDEIVVLASSDIAQELAFELVHNFGESRDGIEEGEFVVSSLTAGVGGTYEEADKAMNEAKAPARKAAKEIEILF